jgi:DNA-binding transcriptional LysR family regulator
MDRFGSMMAFVRVVETGSFSGAARLLRRGQPAVSKSVAQLERRLGVKLLTRSTHGLSPTEAGQRFYERAKRALDEADQADLIARGAGNGLTGRLRIAAPVTFTRLHLMPRLAAFLAEHPSVDLDVVLDDRRIDLVQEGIDVALRMGPLTDSSLAARRIGRSPRFVIAAPSYLKRAGTPKLPADLVGHDGVIYAQDGERRAWSFRQNGSETSVALRARLKVSAAEGVRAAVLAGLGLTVASAWMFPELRSGKVKAVLTCWELPILDLWAVFPTGRGATTKARAFVSFIERSLPNLVDIAGPHGGPPAPVLFPRGMTPSTTTHLPESPPSGDQDAEE